MPDKVKFFITIATCETLTPLLMSSSKRSEATSKPPETPIQPEAFNNKQRSLVKLFSKRIFVHQVITIFHLIISIAKALIKAGGAASSTK